MNALLPCNAKRTRSCCGRDSRCAARARHPGFADAWCCGLLVSETPSFALRSEIIVEMLYAISFDLPWPPAHPELRTPPFFLATECIPHTRLVFPALYLLLLPGCSGRAQQPGSDLLAESLRAEQAPLHDEQTLQAGLHAFTPFPRHAFPDVWFPGARCLSVAFLHFSACLRYHRGYFRLVQFPLLHISPLALGKVVVALRCRKPELGTEPHSPPPHFVVFQKILGLVFLPTFCLPLRSPLPHHHIPQPPLYSPPRTSPCRLFQGRHRSGSSHSGSGSPPLSTSRTFTLTGPGAATQPRGTGDAAGETVGCQPCGSGDAGKMIESGCQRMRHRRLFPLCTSCTPRRAGCGAFIAHGHVAHARSRWRWSTRQVTSSPKTSLSALPWMLSAAVFFYVDRGVFGRHKTSPVWSHKHVAFAVRDWGVGRWGSCLSTGCGPERRGRAQTSRADRGSSARRGRMHLHAAGPRRRGWGKMGYGTLRPDCWSLRSRACVRCERRCGPAAKRMIPVANRPRMVSTCKGGLGPANSVVVRFCADPPCASSGQLALGADCPGEPTLCRLQSRFSSASALLRGAPQARACPLRVPLWTCFPACVAPPPLLPPSPDQQWFFDCLVVWCARLPVCYGLLRCVTVHRCVLAAGSRLSHDELFS